MQSTIPDHPVTVSCPAPTIPASEVSRVIRRKALKVPRLPSNLPGYDDLINEVAS